MNKWMKVVSPDHHQTSWPWGYWVHALYDKPESEVWPIRSQLIDLWTNSTVFYCFNSSQWRIPIGLPTRLFSHMLMRVLSSLIHQAWGASISIGMRQSRRPIRSVCWARKRGHADHVFVMAWGVPLAHELQTISICKKKTHCWLKVEDPRSR
jgi:hypothetical protein